MDYKHHKTTLYILKRLYALRLSNTLSVLYLNMYFYLMVHDKIIIRQITFGYI